MKIKDLYKRDLNLVPFASYIDQEVLFEEYHKAPLIPDLYLFLQKAFPGKIINENIPAEKLETARAEFFKQISQDTIPEDCKKPDIYQTETFRSLEKLSNSYDKFLEHIATSENPEQRAELIEYQLSELNLKNQLSIIDHILTDDTVPTAIKIGKIKLNRTNLIALDIVEQRLEDFKNRIVQYKNSLSLHEPKVSRLPKTEKKFEEYFTDIDSGRLSALKTYLLELWDGKLNQLSVAFAIFSLKENGYIKENILVTPFVYSFISSKPNINSTLSYLKADENGLCSIEYILANESEDLKKKIRYDEINEIVLNVLARPPLETKENTC